MLPKTNPVETKDLSPENVIALWLQPYRDNKNYSGFVYITLSEVEGLREKVVEPLAKTLFVHHNDPEKFRKNVEALGYPQAAKQIDKRPQIHSTRMGNFGEVLAAEFLKQHRGYDIPVYRLRYNQNPESSLKGNDLLAFKFGDSEERGRELVIGEVKTMSEFDSREIEHGYDQLLRERPRPKSIPFVVEVLQDQGKHEQANQVLRFLDELSPNKPTKVSFMFIVTGNEPRDPFAHIQGQKRIMPNLVAARVYLEGLGKLVDLTFSQEVSLD